MTTLDNRVNPKLIYCVCQPRTYFIL